MAFVTLANARFYAVLCACRRSRYSPLAPVVSECGNNFLLNKNCFADGAMFALGKSGFGACGFNCRIGFFRMTRCGDFTSFNVAFVTLANARFYAVLCACCRSRYSPLTPVMSECVAVFECFFANFVAT